LTSLTDPFNSVTIHAYNQAGQLGSVFGSGPLSVPAYISQIQYWGVGRSKADHELVEELPVTFLALAATAARAETYDPDNSNRYKHNSRDGIFDNMTAPAIDDERSTRDLPSRHTGGGWICQPALGDDRLRALTGRRIYSSGAVVSDAGTNIGGRQGYPASPAHDAHTKADRSYC